MSENQTSMAEKIKAIREYLDEVENARRQSVNAPHFKPQGIASPQEPCGCAISPKRGYIDCELGDLENSTAELSESVAALSDRLLPVMNDSVQTAPEPTDTIKPPPMPVVAERIRSSRTSIQASIQRLNMLRNSLEI